MMLPPEANALDQTPDLITKEHVLASEAAAQAAERASKAAAKSAYELLLLYVRHMAAYRLGDVVAFRRNWRRADSPPEYARLLSVGGYVLDNTIHLRYHAQPQTKEMRDHRGRDTVMVSEQEIVKVVGHRETKGG